MNKILITGAGGGLGAVLTKFLIERYKVIATDSSSLDVTDYITVDQIIGQVKPDLVIHCAAIVNADQAQGNKLRTYQVNVAGTEAVAQACKKYGSEMMFFSSDYVFNGETNRPYEVTDLVDPINYYGITKIIGEQIVRDLVPHNYIVRVSWLFGPAGNTFLQKMLKKAGEEFVQVVDDQIGSPTYTPHLSKALEALFLSQKWGTYQITNEGFCSWADYAEEIFRLAGSHTKVIRVDSSIYQTLAKRPLNSCLSKEKIYAAGIGPLPHWKDALRECFEKRVFEIEQ